MFSAHGVAANGLLAPKIVLAWMMTAILSLGSYPYFECPARSFIHRILARDSFGTLILRKPPAVHLSVE
jgi:hypothetical protein